MREEWILENDFMYQDAQLPDNLESIFGPMDSNRDGHISDCAFIGAMMLLSVRSNRS